MVFVVANWPTSRKDHWLTLLKARAIENQCFVIGVNRTGISPQGLHFPGASTVFDPFGNEICRGSETEAAVIADIDVNEVIQIRKKFPFLEDMQPSTLMLGE
jgi:predicted amidohydrolase